MEKKFGIALVILREEIWKNVVTYGAAFLLVIQEVAKVSLLITTSEEAYKRPFGDDRLSGEEQYTVSAKDNVIVFVLDYFSSLYCELSEKLNFDGFQVYFWKSSVPRKSMISQMNGCYAL